MIQRKLDNQNVAPSPVPGGAYANYDNYGYGAQDYAQQGQGYNGGYNNGYNNGYTQNYATNLSDHGHSGYTPPHPYAQDPVPSSNPYNGGLAVPAARATTRTGAPRDSRVVSRVDDEDVYGGI